MKIQMKKRRIEECGVGRGVVSGRNWEEMHERRCSGGPKERVPGQSAPSREGTINLMGDAVAGWWYQLLVSLRRLEESLSNG